MANIMRFIVVFVLIGCVLGGAPYYDVTHFGAYGDGKNDDTQYFLKAWSTVCNDPRSPTLLVPSGKTFFLRQVLFNGPCKSSIHVQVDGNIVGPNGRWLVAKPGTWISFAHTKHLTVDGKGQLDGQGSAWWPCISKGNCGAAPDAFGVFGCDNFKMGGLTFINSPGKHVDLYGSANVYVSGIHIKSPGDSPNTDGMHIQECQHVQVDNIDIQSGDDCISIGAGSLDVNVTQITCGPGHGISIGSLGMGGVHEEVQQVRVSDCFFVETQNGARIKTWEGGSGFVKGITFENLNFSSVRNPVLIDQQYCPSKKCKKKRGAVALRDVQFSGLTGTTITPVAITLNCSMDVGCTGVELQNVNLKLAGSGALSSFCINAHGSKAGHLNPDVPCLKS